MTRHVFDNRMVAHTWMHPRSENDHARSNNGNLWFQGATIYSYGHHFPIASRHKSRSGQLAVLFTTSDYSITTCMHKSYVRCAIPSQTPVFYVPIVEAHPTRPDWHPFNLARYQACYDAKIRRAGRLNVHSRRPAQNILDDAHDIALTSQAYCDFFGLSHDGAVTEISETERERILARWERLNSPEAEAKRERNRAKREERAKRKRQREAEKVAEHIESWRQGAHVPIDLHWLPCMLRMAGEEIQTSHGARFPVDDAIKAYRLIKAIRHRGQAWRRNGEHIPLGHFQIDSVSPEGNVVAGCHRVRWDEIALCAQALGLE